MNKKYNNLIKYDKPFTEPIIKRGLEIYLNNKVSIEEQNNNTYLSYITGTNTYEVEVSFNDKEELTNWSCDCPYFIENGYCKHTYALISKIKLDYDYTNIDREIRKNLKILKKKCKLIHKAKTSHKQYERLYNDYQNTKTLLENIMLLKEIYYYINKLDQELMQDRTYNTNNDYEYDKGPGLFSLFFSALDSVNKQQEENNKWYEEEKKRYRDAIVEQNLYNGKKYEDLYDELNGDIKK